MILLQQVTEGQLTKKAQGKDAKPLATGGIPGEGTGREIPHCSRPRAQLANEITWRGVQRKNSRGQPTGVLFRGAGQTPAPRLVVPES